MAAPLLIECLFAPDCNSRENILPLVDRVVRKMALRAEIKEIEVRNQHEAVELRFLGSPSIHVKGKDIEPDSENRENYSLG